MRPTPSNLTFGSSAELWIGASRGLGVTYRHGVAADTGQREDGNGDGAEEE